MKKMVCIVIAVLIICSLGLNSFAAVIIPDMAGNISSLKEKAITAIFTPGIEATVSNGYMNLYHIYSSGVSNATISKTITTDLPTTGKVEFSICSKVAIQNSLIVKLYSGSDVVANACFPIYEKNCTVNDKSLCTTTKYGYLLANSSCKSTIELDYTNNRIVLKGVRDGGLYMTLTDKYYDDTGSNTDSQGNVYTSSSSEAKLGYPITLTGGTPAGGINKIEVMLKNDSGNGTGCIWGGVNIKYDYITLKHTASDSTETIYINDQFNDNQTISDCGYIVVAKKMYFFKDQSGMGFVQADSANVFDAVMEVPLGTTINSGKVVFEFTREARKVFSDGTTEPLPPTYNNFGLFNIYGGGTKRVSFYQNGRTTDNRSIYSSNSSQYDGTMLTTGFKYNTDIVKFQIIVDCSDGSIKTYVAGGENENYNNITYVNSAFMTADGNGAYTIDKIYFSNYLGKTDGTYYSYINYKNINIYTLDSEKNVPTPVLLNAGNTALTGLTANAKVNAYVPVKNSADSDITLIFALFDSNDTFLNAAYTDVRVPSKKASSGTNLGHAEYTLPDNVDGCYLKAFVWNNMENLSPYALPIQFPAD